jgi:Gpi18-like mannosyltransferase
LSEMKQTGSGGRAVAFLVFFPTALFLVAPYTEALFLAGAVAAFYYAKQGRWLLVALPAAIAMGTRAAGVFLLAGLMVEFLIQRDFSRAKVRDATAALVAASLPLLAYFAYLQSRTGNFFYYFQMQREGWGRSFTSPRDSFLLTWRTWNESTDTNWIMVWRLEIVAALLGLLVVAWAWRRREGGYATYMGLSLAALLTSTWYFSIPRMMLSFFPIAIFMATARRIRHDYVLAASAGLAVLGTIVFTRGAWFF